MQSVYRRDLADRITLWIMKTLRLPSDFSGWGPGIVMRAARLTHSRDDRQGEVYEDGLHVVVGEVDLPDPSFSFSFVVNGRRFLPNKEETMEKYDRLILPPMDDGIDMVNCMD